MERDQRAASPPTPASSFALRVGINTGEVLAGQVGDGYTVIGDTVNVAARLQARGRARAASPSARAPTALTRGAIEYDELEPLELKGKAEPVPAWEAVRLLVPGAAPRGARATTPLVGRERRARALLGRCSTGSCARAARTWSP